MTKTLLILLTLMLSSNVAFSACKSTARVICSTAANRNIRPVVVAPRPIAAPVIAAPVAVIK